MTDEGMPGAVTQTRAVVAHGARDLRIESRTVQPLRRGEVLVEIAYGGVCGSDVHYFTRGGVGDNLIREPLTLGHEVAGRVVMTHPDDSPSQIAAGTAVTVHPATPCRTWSQDPATPANLAEGVAYLGSAGTNPHTQGAFADHVVVRTDQLVVLPAHLDLRRAALAEPLGVALHAVRRAAQDPHSPLDTLLTGRSVAVVGAGPIGCLVVAASRAAGAAHVAASDLSARALAVAGAAGAHALADVSDLTPVEAARALIDAADVSSPTNRGFDVVIESSGSVPGLVTALHAVRRGGVVVGLGLLPPGELPIPVNLLITREVTFLGSFRFVAEIDEAVELLAGGLPVGPVITHEFDADDAEHALQVAADPRRSTKVLLRMSGADDSRRPVVVLGLMGAGKTTLATTVAQRTGRTLRDSDADLEQAHGRSGREIADSDGVDALHALEIDHVLTALADGDAVVAAAAYVVEDERVRRALAGPLVIWLDTAPADLADRASTAVHRRSVADMSQTLTDQRVRRGPWFAEAADLVLDASVPPEDLADQAVAWIADRDPVSPADPTGDPGSR